MANGRKALALVAIAILVVATLSVYSVVATAKSVGQGQTISSLESTLSSMNSHPLISVSTTTITFSSTDTRLPSFPWNSSSANYMAGANFCNGGYSGACFSTNFGNAYVFTCLDQAATAQGCTVRMNATNSASFVVVTVWYPYHNSTAGAPAWANCAWNNPGGKGPSQFYAALPSYCFTLGGNAFILAGPPPLAL